MALSVKAGTRSESLGAVPNRTVAKGRQALEATRGFRVQKQDGSQSNWKDQERGMKETQKERSKK